MMGMSAKVCNFQLCGDLRVAVTLPSNEDDLSAFSPPFLSGIKVYVELRYFLTNRIENTPNSNYLYFNFIPFCGTDPAPLAQPASLITEVVR